MNENMALYVGPNRAGLLLEVGVVEWHDTIAIVHATPASAKFLR